MGFKKYNGSTWQPIKPKKLKGVPYTGTLPAVLTGTKAGYLQRYKIYGNTEQVGTPTPENPIEPSECGERTENILGLDTSVYYPVDISLGERITMFKGSTGGASTYLQFYDAQKQKIVEYTLASNLRTRTITYTDNTDCKYVNWRVTPTNPAGAVIGSTPPDHYIPYGYKLPLTSGNTPVDIYIGDDTLSTEEYVDSGTGKIYRMIGGALTPVDPPVPFPQLPTTVNSTTIGWAGEGLAPSQFDSIQEWVDIPTYTRVNGEWVADN